jgi:hypothetical protein
LFLGFIWQFWLRQIDIMSFFLICERFFPVGDICMVAPRFVAFPFPGSLLKRLNVLGLGWGMVSGIRCNISLDPIFSVTAS